MYMPKSAVEVTENPTAPGSYMPASAKPVEEPSNPLAAFAGGVKDLGSGIVKGVVKGIDSSVGEFGRRLGQAAYMSVGGGTKQFEEQQKQAGAQSELLLKKAIELQKSGRKEEAKKLFEMAGQINQNSAKEADTLNADMEQAKRDTVTSGVKTGLLTVGAPAVGAGGAAMGIGLGGGMEAGRQAISGEGINLEKVGEAGGTGLVSSAQAAGLTRFSNPATQFAMGKFAGGVANPVAQRAVQGVVGGAANTAENAALAKGTGQKFGAGDAATSFGIGFGMGAIGNPADAPKTASDVMNQGLNNNALEDSIKSIPGAIKGAPGAIKGAIDTTTGAAGKVPGALMKPFVKGAEKVSDINGEDLYGRLATSLMKVDPGEYASDPQKYEELARNFAKYTTRQDTRESIKELSTMSRNANQYIKDFASKADSTVGKMETASVIEEVKSSLLENPQIAQYAKHYPDVFAGFMKDVENRLDDGNGGASFSSINTARTWGNGVAKPYYKNGQILAQETPAQVESLFASGLGKSLKDMLVSTVAGTEDGANVAKALDLQHTAIQVLPAVSAKEFSNQTSGRSMGFTPGRVASGILHPFGKRSALAVIRGADKIAEDDKQFIDMMRNYKPSNLPKVEPADINPLGLPPVGQENAGPTVTTKKAGTAFDMRGHGTKKAPEAESIPESAAPSADTSKKSVTTNIQAKYAEETPKVGDGRRNASSQIVQRALDTKGKAQKTRFLADYPQAKNPESLSRSAQEKILRALKSRKYS
jgi:hypothetical protein